MYAKLENNKMTYAPKNYNTGVNLILNFNKNIELMKKYGFKEVIDNKPSYNNTTQYPTISGYTENDDNITINYKINEIEINNEPTLEDRIIELEKINKEQDKLINTTMLTTDEMLSILEPLLIDLLTNEKSYNKIADMYTVMIKRGLKKEEDIPERYRDLVQKNIE